ncbi:calcium calmodulin-dependent protein kinase type 1G [Phlyctochytrium planicorne]|nr:calcium calmodulin-dependent protein kinase type 1G [Phlyctochytrium planicorne]
MIGLISPQPKTITTSSAGMKDIQQRKQQRRDFESACLSHGDRKMLEYRRVRQLGMGTQGTVSEVRHLPSGQTFAMKTTDKRSSQNVKNVAHEIAMLEMIEHHDNIVGMVEAFETADSMHLVLEEARGGDLFDKIRERKFFTETEAADVMFDLFSALDHLQNLGIVHCDVKPENIFFKNETDDDIMLGDFGISATLHEKDSLRAVCGSPAYIAPEMIQGYGYCHPVDIWASGVVLFTMLMGYGPFYHCHDVSTTYRAIRRGDWRFESPYADRVSDAGKRFICHLMYPDPENRPEAALAMMDPWMIANSKKAQKFIRQHLANTNPHAPPPKPPRSRGEGSRRKSSYTTASYTRTHMNNGRNSDGETTPVSKFQRTAYLSPSPEP